MQFEELGRKDLRRNGKGQAMVVPRTGGKAVPMSRPTVIAGTLDDRYNLEKHFQRYVVLGLAARPDLVEAAAGLTALDKNELNRIAKQAQEAAGINEKRDLGTLIHRAIEIYNRGGQPPARYAKHVAAYQKALDVFGAEVDQAHVEQVIVNERYGAAGTFDMRLRVGGVWYIADLKTGDVEHGATTHAVQLYLYASATSWYDPATETHSPPEPVDQERAIIVHLPAPGDGCTLYWLDIAAGREALEHALWTRKWRSRKDLLVPVVAAVAPQPEPATPKKVVARKKAERPAKPRVTKANAAPKIAPVADSSDTPEWRREGDLVADELVADVRRRAMEIDTDVLHGWVKEASDAGVPFGMGGGSHTERRYRIASAALAIAEQDTDPDYARAVLACVHGDDAHKAGVTIGSLLGHLSADQATAVDRIARTGVPVIDDNGRLQIEQADQ